jgi:hypothetical protein
MLSAIRVQLRLLVRMEEDAVYLEIFAEFVPQVVVSVRRVDRENEIGKGGLCLNPIHKSMRVAGSVASKTFHPVGSNSTTRPIRPYSADDNGNASGVTYVAVPQVRAGFSEIFRGLS